MHSIDRSAPGPNAAAIASPWTTSSTSSASWQTIPDSRRAAGYAAAVPAAPAWLRPGLPCPAVLALSADARRCPAAWGRRGGRRSAAHREQDRTAGPQGAARRGCRTRARGSADHAGRLVLRVTISVPDFVLPLTRLAVDAGRRRVLRTRRPSRARHSQNPAFAAARLDDHPPAPGTVAPLTDAVQIVSSWTARGLTNASARSSPRDLMAADRVRGGAANPDRFPRLAPRPGGKRASGRGRMAGTVRPVLPDGRSPGLRHDPQAESLQGSLG